MNRPPESRGSLYDGAADGPVKNVVDEPYAQEPMDVEEDAPRRAASARFIVDAEVGSEAALRDAMDPANQSLADALRMSYRVLQAVIVVLIVLFLASGLRTVDEGKTGVRTVWGDIQTDQDGATLSPGLKFSLFPYPIGDFIIFDAENRSVDLGEAFAPAKRGRTQSEMLEQAQGDAALMPGVDGSLVTREGDLAHIELGAKYVIDSAVDFVQSVNDADADRSAEKLVKLAVERATIQVVAGLSLEELLDSTRAEDIRQRIQKNAQEVLDGLHCGIEVTQVDIKDTYAPLSIQKAFGDLTAAGVAAAEQIEKAQQAANKLLQEKAGEKHKELIPLIEQYEEALDRGNEQEHSQILAQINEILKSPQATGEVANIIQDARGYQWQIEKTLGLDYRRFDGFLNEYRANPRLFVTQQRLNTLASVLNMPDTEIFYVDPAMPIRLSLNGSSDIQEKRRESRILQKNIESRASKGKPEPLRAREMSIGKAGRTLVRDREGRLIPLGSDR